jgi:hypothetical protein
MDLSSAPCSTTDSFLNLSLSLMLRPTVSRPVYLGIKHPSGAHHQILLLSDSYWLFDVGRSLTRGRVCRLQLLLALASAVILVSESRWTQNHILLSQIRDCPFRRLLLLAGLRWRYSTPPPHGNDSCQNESQSYVTTKSLLLNDRCKLVDVGRSP